MNKLNNLVPQVSGFVKLVNKLDCYTFCFSIYKYKSEISFTVRNSILKYYKLPNQLSEIVRIIGIVIDFVVSSGSKNEMKIFDYVTKILKMDINKDVCKTVSII